MQTESTKENFIVILLPHKFLILIFLVNYLVNDAENLCFTKK